MMKSTDQNKHSSPLHLEGSSRRYKGVRKRKWGKFVSEIRLPNSRERIWLGSYNKAEQAARAFDAALFCLRGRKAKFNFPDSMPEIPNGGSLSPGDIQDAAARYAQSDDGGPVAARSEDSDPGWIPLSSSDSQSTSQLDGEISEIPLDGEFLDLILAAGNGDNTLVCDLGPFSGFDDFSGEFFTPNIDHVDSWSDINNHGISSTLWNF